MHTVRHKKKLVARIRRVKGQIDAVERALSPTSAGARRSSGRSRPRAEPSTLAAEVLCDHLEDHLAAPRFNKAELAIAATELARVIRQFVG